jgi:hypothetical protein
MKFLFVVADNPNWSRLEYLNIRGIAVHSDVIHRKIISSLDARAIFSAYLEFASSENSEPLAETEHPPIPELRPASIRPVWRGDKIYQNPDAAGAELDDEIILGNLLALKDEFEDLSTEIKSERNIDRRPGEYIGKTGALIKSELPDNATLFRLTRREAVLLAYAPITNDQWPDFLAKRYSALCTELSKVLDQFPARRAFDRNVLEIEVEDMPLESIHADVQSVTQFLRDDKAEKRIDSSVPDTIDQICDESADLPLALPANSRNPRIIMAADQLESVNNTLKALAERADEDPSSRDLLETIAAAYSKGLEQGIQDGAKEAGTATGKIIGKGFGHAMLADSASRVVGPVLSKKYPKWFRWLERYIRPQR